MLSRIKKLVSSVTDQAMAKEPLVDQRISERPNIVQRLSAMRRGRGKGNSGESEIMPLRIPINANNAEKAWEIWSAHLRQRDPSLPSVSKEDMAQFLMLLVKSGSAQMASMFDSPTKTEDTAQHLAQEALASFRVLMVLRYMFSQAIRARYIGQSHGNASSSTPVSASVSFETENIRLGLDQRGYEKVVRSLTFSVDPTMRSFNTETPVFRTGEELAVYVNEVSIARVIYAVLCAALQDGNKITNSMLHMALEAAITLRDTTATRDILRLCYPDLAKLLDPKDTQSIVSGTPDNASIDPSSDDYRTAVELTLKAASVGYDPQILESSALSDIEQQGADYEQFEDISAFRGSQESGSSKPESIAKWRADTAECIYRAYISSGIKEIPAPDDPKQRALQGSVVPSPLMISYLLDVYCKAADVELSTILYDSLISQLPQLRSEQQTLPSVSNDSEEVNVQKPAAVSVLGSRLWMDMFRSMCAMGHLWPAARVLGDMIQDGCKPTSKMYQRYLSLIADPTREKLIDALDILKQCVLPDGICASNRRIRSPLVCALSRTGLSLPTDYANERVEQAIKLSGLPLTIDDAKAASSSTESTAVVSLNSKRRIISALMYTGQILRAQELAEIWSADLPDLLNAKKVAELIDALGHSGEYEKALSIFIDYQQIADNEVTVDILSAVLKVYVHANDFTEAISVGKRLRAMVNDAPEADRMKLLPHRNVYEFMVRACSEHGMPAEALRILEEMRRYKINATSQTYATLIKMMGGLRSYDGLKLITALAHVDYNMEATADVCVYQDNMQLPSGPLPLSTDYYNALIEAYGRVAEPTKALQCWELMRIRGVKPNNLTATLLFDICGWNERVHWEENMVMHDEFVEIEIPDDHVFTGIPFFHLHYLAAVLKQLEEAGLVFSMTNYRHLIETLLRFGFFEDVLRMMVGKHEDPELTSQYDEDGKLLLDRGSWSVFTVFGDFVERVKGNEKHEPRESRAKFIENLSFNIPVCKETVHTVYGMISALRAKCVPEEGVDPPDLPFVQQVSPNLFRRLEISEDRFDNVIRNHYPDLLPEHKREVHLIQEDMQQQQEQQ
ncbi:hypothetical protein LPJ72_000928 [Coemansia sp. Benny D160-2]|nr:hypothetical protein LPJ72_000928 [Coemansia sp. Benny D160-2]